MGKDGKIVYAVGPSKKVPQLHHFCGWNPRVPKLQYHEGNSSPYIWYCNSITIYLLIFTVYVQCTLIPVCMVMVNICEYACMCIEYAWNLVHFSQHKVLLAEASSTFQAMRRCPLAPAPLELNDAVHPHQKRKLPEGLGRGGGGSAVHPMCHPFTVHRWYLLI